MSQGYPWGFPPHLCPPGEKVHCTARITQLHPCQMRSGFTPTPSPWADPGPEDTCLPHSRSRLSLAMQVPRIIQVFPHDLHRPLVLLERHTGYRWAQRSRVPFTQSQGRLRKRVVVAYQALRKLTAGTRGGLSNPAKLS